VAAGLIHGLALGHIQEPRAEGINCVQKGLPIRGAFGGSAFRMHKGGMKLFTAATGCAAGHCGVRCATTEPCRDGETRGSAC
jgi:hypothetical protein